jgi:hypothetical protein
MTDRPEIVAVDGVRAPRGYLARHGVVVCPPRGGRASRVRRAVGAAPEPPTAIGTALGKGHAFGPNA